MSVSDVSDVSNAVHNSSDEQRLQAYAKVAVRVGVNIQPGQTLAVAAPVSAVRLVRAVAAAAYDAGAAVVDIDWDDARLNRLRLLRAAEEGIDSFPTWRADRRLQLAHGGAAFLSLAAPAPGLLRDVPADRISRSTTAAHRACAASDALIYRDVVPWSVLAFPNADWADAVYPHLPAAQRLPRLWESVLRVCRIDQVDPIAAWRSHVADLAQQVKRLNDARFQRLHYRAPGTDLTVDLPVDHVWVGGQGRTPQGVDFVPNIPTEEVFTAPLRTGVNGVVSNTLPLNTSGSVIERFRLRFDQGRVTECRAEVGQEVLQSILDRDEGARYLGEAALVPMSGLVGREGVVFHDTGYDENAACHLALGSAYPINVRGGNDMSDGQLLARGLNRSSTHVDFLIGSRELDVDGCTPSGEWQPVMRSGEWA